MPEKITFEHLSEKDIAAAVNMYRNSHIPTILDHLFSKAISEHYAKFMQIEKEDFDAHRTSLLKMEDMRGLIKLENPPKPIHK